MPYKLSDLFEKEQRFPPRQRQCSDAVRCGTVYDSFCRIETERRSPEGLGCPHAALRAERVTHVCILNDDLTGETVSEKWGELLQSSEKSVARRHAVAADAASVSDVVGISRQDCPVPVVL